MKKQRKWRNGGKRERERGGVGKISHSLTRNVAEFLVKKAPFFFRFLFCPFLFLLLNGLSMNVIGVAAVASVLLVLLVLLVLGLVEVVVAVRRWTGRDKQIEPESETVATSAFWRVHDPEVAKLSKEVAAAEEEADSACDDVLQQSTQLMHLNAQLARLEKEMKDVDQKKREAINCERQLRQAEKELKELHEMEDKLSKDLEAAKARIAMQNSFVQKHFESVPYDIKLAQLCCFWESRLAPDLKYKQGKGFDIDLDQMFPRKSDDASSDDEEWE